MKGLINMLKSTQSAYNSNEVRNMVATTLFNARLHLRSLINKAIKREPVTITTPYGNVVLVDEQEFNDWKLTLEVHDNPEFMQSLTESINIPEDEWIDEEAFSWRSTR
ncbi:MAG: hypothetical protein LBL34_01325 [Clostridiales bacterium]|jgi:PHD/YefM family antitoxin component YafN of YafNO toxin-antitoxin module|nr:hypothetical protein [Clostridiales bacterium]